MKKNILHYHIPGKEDHLTLLVLLWFVLLGLLYLASIVYVVIDFMHRPNIMPRDVVIGAVGYKLHRRIVPFFRKQIFAKH